MKWETYYEKVFEWATTTAVSRISSLEDMGPPDEITEVIQTIGYDDKKGATRLLNKALKTGVRFSGENLAELVHLCQDDVLRQALEQSAPEFTGQDLEDLYGCVDDQWLLEVIRKYNLSAPESLEEDYEEELAGHVAPRISWEKFYDRYSGWSEDYARARLRDVTGLGSGTEIAEVVVNVLGDDQAAADNLVNRALKAGICFGCEELGDIAVHCSEAVSRKAVLAAKDTLTEEDLEELYGQVEDDVLIEVANRRGVRPPMELRNDGSWVDPEQAIYEAIFDAQLALSALYDAQRALNEGAEANLWDMIVGRHFTAWHKYDVLSRADEAVRRAQILLNMLDQSLKELQMNQTVRLKASQLAWVTDIWSKGGLLDCLVSFQLSGTSKRVRRAITKVQKILKELEALRDSK